MDKMVTLPLQEYENLTKELDEHRKALESDKKHIFKSVHYGYGYAVSVYSSDEDLTKSIKTLEEIKNYRMPRFNFWGRTIGEVIEEIKHKK